MEITRTTARKMRREKEMRWKKYRERERNRAWAGGRREKKRGENFFDKCHLMKITVEKIM